VDYFVDDTRWLTQRLVQVGDASYSLYLSHYFVLAALGVGCRTPVAGHATVEVGRLTVRGLVGRPDASEMLFERVEGRPEAAAELGAELGARLIARGADKILADLESS